jgi:hypothetical protein
MAWAASHRRPGGMCAAGALSIQAAYGTQIRSTSPG